MVTFKLEIPGSPQAWQRPRSSGRSGGKPIFFEAKHVKSWRQYIRALAGSWPPSSMLGGTKKDPIPLIVIVNFYMSRPRRLYRKKDPPGTLPAPTRPDLDNLYKGVVDALEGIVFRDDALICSAHMNKYYHEKEGKPRTTIEILEVKDDAVDI